MHWYQFLTSDFVHGGWFHLIGNMLFLLVFGDNVEDAFGPIPFLLLYFLGGLAGDMMWVHANPSIDFPSVGASGCISALAGAYCLLFFSSRIGVRLMFLVFNLRTFYFGAPWVLLFWFGGDVYRTLAWHGVTAGEPDVNFVAHGVGFLIGFVVALVAILAGVLRRYQTLAEGHDWFGYWPSSLEKKRRGKVRGTRR